MTANKFDDGVAPSRLKRLMSYVLLGFASIMIVIPPVGFWAILAMVGSVFGLLRIARGASFPNAWWFWLYTTLAFVINSGIVFPITEFEMPTHPLPLTSYALGCAGALVSGILAITMFLQYAWLDLRAGRIRFEDND